jgi:hypothetical protein
MIHTICAEYAAEKNVYLKNASLRLYVIWIPVTINHIKSNHYWNFCSRLERDTTVQLYTPYELICCSR